MKISVKTQGFPSQAAHRHPLRAAAFAIISILFVLALGDYSPKQTAYLSTAPTQSNCIGNTGATVAFASLSWFGLAAWFIPIGFIWVAYRNARFHPETLGARKLLSAFAAFIAAAGLLGLIQTALMPAGFLERHYPNYFVHGLGGVLGSAIVNGFLWEYLGPLGSTIVLFSLFGIGITGAFLDQAALAWLQTRWNRWLQRARSPQIAKTPIATSAPRSEKPLAVKRSKAPAKSKVIELEEEESDEEPEEIQNASEVKQSAPQPLNIIRSEAPEKSHACVPVQRGNYIFPSIDLLSEPVEMPTDSQENHQETAEALLRTLEEFGVKVTLGEIHSGPVITRYEVTPAPGVRVEKILSLDKNIALALKAISVRILAPVPGKGSVGIEVPNRNPSPVCLREIIESTAWAKAGAEIPVVLGKEVTGKPLVADLTKMPHLLIAGSTGAGKTVCINSIIASLLYHSSPEDLRFLMVDPKIVEMQIFNSLPHMLIPVVTKPKLVPGALKWLLNEMENRYQIFAQMGVRNIAGFNAKILKDKAEEAKAQELEAELSPEERAAVSSLEVPRDLNFEVPKHKLPYIVCIIDELADLMMVAPADIETCIARLAQLARAAGIHLIIATQRPSVNVITGVIKANLPSRIAFKVASKVDSRTILDYGGADKLIGRGDMLFVPPGTSNLVRAQGSFVSDDEIHRLVEFLKRNGPPKFAEEVQRQVESSDPDDKGSEEGEWDDSMVPQALDVLRSTKRASTSMLQRRLRIGYNRAARIMELLEDQGIVGPENGAQPREILRDLDNLN